MDEDGCPLDTRQLPQPTLILEKLVSLWEHGFHKCAQISGRARDGRPYFLEDRELIWDNPSMRFPLPQNRVHVLKYHRVILASTSIAHKHNLKNKVTMPSGGDDPIAPRWRTMLKIDWVHSPTNRLPWWWTGQPIRSPLKEHSYAHHDQSPKEGPRVQ